MRGVVVGLADEHAERYGLRFLVFAFVVLVRRFVFVAHVPPDGHHLVVVERKANGLDEQHHGAAAVAKFALLLVALWLAVFHEIHVVFAHIVEQRAERDAVLGQFFRRGFALGYPFAPEFHGQVVDLERVVGQSAFDMVVKAYAGRRREVAFLFKPSDEFLHATAVGGSEQGFDPFLIGLCFHRWVLIWVQR